MILIADSGGTKTDWRVISSDGKISQASTKGMNPYQNTTEDLSIIVSEELIPQLNQHGAVQTLYFYGAGCGSNENQVMMHQVLAASFPQARIIIENDMLAAARALCGTQAGIACILGTGSNSCLYDGQNIQAQRPSLGYVLSDEGSGRDMGARLIRAYYYDEMPTDYRALFESKFDLKLSELLENIYKKPAPASYIASFTQILSLTRNHPFTHELVTASFESFVATQIKKYPRWEELPVHFSGSIAFHFSDLLRNVAIKHGFSLQNIIQSPIAGLTLYHQSIL